MIYLNNIMDVLVFTATVLQSSVINVIIIRYNNVIIMWK